MPPDIEFDDPAWGAAGGLNGQPPLILADLPPEVRTIIEQLVGVLGISGNLGVPTDNLDAETGQLERDTMTADAQTKFPGSEENSAQMLQTVPQLASGIAGAIGGAVSGALQPFAQFAQQGAQAGTQAMQTGLGALQDVGADPVDDLADELGGEFGDTGGFGIGGTGGTGGLADTSPSAQLGPPSTPSASTFPASAPNTSAPQPVSSASAAGSRMPMGAMPFMPGGMQGAAPAGETKPDTKRVVAPNVRNGAPVQGRLTSPPPVAEVTRHVKGKPVATRRIVPPAGPAEEDAPDR